MPGLDDRLLRVTISLNNGASTHVFERLAISAIGTKHTSTIQNFAEISITNMDKDVRDQLLTEGTPYAQFTPPKNSILVEAGRESSGLAQVYIGDITTVEVTQAPDITLKMRALTGQHRKSEITALSQGAATPFSTIAKQAASAMGLALDFQAEDKNVSNWSFSGAVEKLTGSLEKITFGVDAYVDDEKLVVKPRAAGASGKVIPISRATGMIGIPEFIDVGVRVTVLMNQDVSLGDDIQLTSEAYPATNGRYQIFRLGFNLANRDTPFYYIIEASRKDRNRVN